MIDGVLKKSPRSFEGAIVELHRKQKLRGNLCQFAKWNSKLGDMPNIDQKAAVFGARAAD